MDLKYAILIYLETLHISAFFAIVTNQTQIIIILTTIFAVVQCIPLLQTHIWEYGYAPVIGYSPE